MQPQPEDPFDPYDAWFQIPRQEQPANFYRLLGLSLFEGRTASIEDAYEQRMINLRSRQTGPRALYAERLKTELTQAVHVLLDESQRQQYDNYLRHLISQATYTQAPRQPEPVAVVAAPVVPTPEAPISISTTSHVHGSGAPKTKSSYTAELIKVILAGIAAIPLAFLFLYYGMNRDPFGLFGKGPPANSSSIATSATPQDEPSSNNSSAVPPNTQGSEVSPPNNPPLGSIPTTQQPPPVVPSNLPPGPMQGLPGRKKGGPTLTMVPAIPLPQGLKPKDPRAGYLAVSTDEDAWYIEDDMLVVEATDEEAIVFGDPAWVDYSFSLEFQKTAGSDVLGILFRVPDPQHRYQCMLGCLDNAWCNLEYVQRGATRAHYNNAQNPSEVPLPQIATPNVIQTNSWQKLRVDVRGTRAQCYLDEQLLFDFSSVKFNFGAVGIRTWGTSARFRNIKVVTLDDARRPLWDGLPVIPDDSLNLAGPMPPGKALTKKKRLAKAAIAKTPMPKMPEAPVPFAERPFITRGYSPEQQALALQPIDEDLKSFQIKLENNRKGMLEDFDQALGLVLGKKSRWSTSKNPTQQMMADQIKREKSLFQRHGYLPFSEPMRRYWVNYIQKGSRAEQLLVAAFNKQIEEYKTNGEQELAAILENEMNILFQKTIVARWRGGAGDWTLYSNFTADGPSGTAPWEAKGNAFYIYWKTADGIEAIDTCNLGPLGSDFAGVNDRGVKFKGTAVYPE